MNKSSKIKVAFTPLQLSLLHQMLLNDCQKRPTTELEKVIKSIKIELFEIFAKKCINYATNPNGKNKIMELKYHQLYIIYDIITKYQNQFSIHEQNTLELLKPKIHQNLLIL